VTGVLIQFSDSLRAAVTAAEQEAQRRRDARIGAEHLLLGMLSAADAAVVGAIGVDLETARQALQSMDRAALAAVGIEVEMTGLPPLAPVRGRTRFTAAAKDVLTRMVAAAKSRADKHLEPTHLLLALLDCEPPDPVCQLLGRLGVDRSVVRARLSEAA
jgi:ATP-dependent Clp protease ATP-binding subunit ClpA